MRVWCLALIAILGCGSPNAPPVPTKIADLVVYAGDTIYVGDTTQAVGVPVDSAGLPLYNRVVNWSVSDPAVLGLSTTTGGNVPVAGRHTGSAIVRGEVEGLSDTFRITVRERVASVTLQPRPSTLTIGDTVQFEAVLRDTAGNILTGRPVDWQASAAAYEEIALESTGRAVVLTGGTTTVKASAEGRSDSLLISLLMDAAVATLAVGEDFNCVTSTLGTGYCWGWNGWGELGGGTAVSNSWAMRRVVNGTSFTRMAARTKTACGLSPAGTASCWGQNDMGQLGNPTDIIPECQIGPCRGSPAAVNGAPAFDSLSLGGSHGCGLTAAGAVYCWGANDRGELGTGSRDATQHGAEAVTGGHTFSAVAAGGAHTCALDGTGAAWCWGENAWGELGRGGADTVAHASPAQVSGGLQFQALAAAASYTCGLTVGGALYCWGTNELGQLGIGASDHLTHSAPVAVTGGLTFRAVATGDRHACAIATSGAAYCWGEDQHGQLGVATVGQTCAYFAFTYPCSGAPVAVSGGLQFSVIRAGTYTTCGIAGDGRVYCWGANGVGQLGDETFENKSSPSRVSGQG